MKKQILCAALAFVLVSVLPLPTNAQRPIAVSPFAVEAGQYVYLHIDGGHLYGRFRLSNPRHDIKVMVFDEDNFENWRNHHQYLLYYESGRVTVGTIDLNLRPGSYYIVFDNTYSIATNKIVYHSIVVQ